MEIMMPSFFPAFRCIAERCRHSCCIGWEIDVDAESARRYRALPGNAGESLRRNLVCVGDTVHFRLLPDGRCPYLEESGLCRLILTLGPDSLCEICREHPRFYNRWGKLTQVGLGLCCEEVCRLVLRQEEPLRFVTVPGEGPDEEEVFPPEETGYLLRAQEELIALLQERALSVSERLRRLLSRARVLQDEWEGFPPAKEPEVFPLPEEEAVLRLASEAEALEESWTQLLHRAAVPGAPVPLSDIALEHAAVCFLYRWFFPFAQEGDLTGAAVLTVRLCVLLCALLRRGAVPDAAEGLRLLSQEIEYSEENTALFSSPPA